MYEFYKATTEPMGTIPIYYPFGHSYDYGRLLYLMGFTDHDIDQIDVR